MPKHPRLYTNNANNVTGIPIKTPEIEMNEAYQINERFKKCEKKITDKNADKNGPISFWSATVVVFASHSNVLHAYTIK